MQEKTVANENKMGVMPVNRLLITMSLPMVISMLVQALYNIVDSIFVARLSENALTAVSVAFPMQSLMISVAGGLGVGINALLSRSLGQKNYKNANKAAMNGLFLEFLGYLIFLILGLTAVRLFYTAQMGEGEITELGVQYLRIVLICSFGIYGQFIFERLLQATGKTIYTMCTQGLGAIINLILDPIMIFGLFGFPKMGISGAAAATVIGQICAAILALVINVKKNDEISLSLKGFRPDGHIIRIILSVGVPSIIMQAIGSVMTFTMNKILIAFSSTAVAVFGVYFKLNSFIFMPIFGMNNGVVPIIAYNYGARKKERLMKAVKYAICYSIAMMLIGLAIFQIFPDKLLLMFDASDTMLSIGVPALRIISLHFAIAGASIILVSSFQALGHGVLSMIVSLIRQFIVLLPAAYILSRFGNVDLVWWAFLIAETVALAISIVFFRRLYNSVIKPL